MAKQNAWKIGLGAGSILLGLYLALNQEGLLISIIGFIIIAFGIGLIAST